MRVLHVSHNINGGGAAIAAWRIFEATRTQPDVDAHLITTGPLPPNCTDASITRFEPKNRCLNHLAESAALRLQKSPNSVHRTLGVFSSGLARKVFQERWDIVHLHWIGLGTLSIREIAKLSAAIPIVWTLHDSWAFCGAEHHPYFENDDRYVDGYANESLFSSARHVNVDACIFKMKRRQWRRPMALVAPSTFMAQCARESALAKDWPVFVIPHPIDRELFRPRAETSRVRILSSVGLDPTRPVALFVSSSGSDVNKGLDLLSIAVQELLHRAPDVQIVGIGGIQPEFPVGAIRLPDLDQPALADWLSAADIVIVPSRLESFSLIAAEARACGTPVLAFQTSGLIDVLQDDPPSTLIPKWDPVALGAKAAELLESTDNRGIRVSKKVDTDWCPQQVGRQYAEIYQRLFASAGNKSSYVARLPAT